ncbi:zinc finger MYM-type protein 1-like protein [Tanacetum coccineum]
MSKKRTIDSFYKRVHNVVQDPEIQTQTQTETEIQTQYQTNGNNVVEESPEIQVEPETNATFDSNEVKLDSLIRDPGKTPASAHNFSVRCYEDLKNKGGDERPTSINQGNYLELVKLIASYNPDVARVLENAPKNAKYSSPDIQKELLQMFAMKVQKAIRDEIGTAKFCFDSR